TVTDGLDVGSDDTASSNTLTMALRRVALTLSEKAGEIEVQRRLLASDPENTLAINALAEMEADYAQLEQEQAVLLAQLGEDTAAEQLQLTSSYTSLDDAKTNREQAADDIATNKS
ncbi:hypothetical protein, partial [Enterovibrio norvegicus]|uniref:hypothetical protein n=1 Tax=Enterovibrio norvegicus TaxID=188144 RepID=UPI000584315E